MLLEQELEGEKPPVGRTARKGEDQVWVAARMQQRMVVEFNPNNTVLLCDLGQVTPLSDSHPKTNSTL